MTHILFCSTLPAASRAHQVKLLLLVTANAFSWGPLLVTTYAFRERTGPQCHHCNRQLIRIFTVEHLGCYMFLPPAVMRPLRLSIPHHPHPTTTTPPTLLFCSEAQGGQCVNNCGQGIGSNCADVCSFFRIPFLGNSQCNAMGGNPCAGTTLVSLFMLHQRVTQARLS